MYFCSQIPAVAVFHHDTERVAAVCEALFIQDNVLMTEITQQARLRLSAFPQTISSYDNLFQHVLQHETHASLYQQPSPVYMDRAGDEAKGEAVQSAFRHEHL